MIWSSLLWMFVVFSLTLQEVEAAAKEFTCDSSKLPALGYYALQKEHDEMMLKIYRNLQSDKSIKWSLSIGKAENQEYRLFFRDAFHLLIVSCYIDVEDDYKRVCGYFEHKLQSNFDKDDPETSVDFGTRFWYYHPFDFQNFSAANPDYDVDMSKIYFEEDDKGAANIHLNNKFYYNLTKDSGEKRKYGSGLMKRGQEINCFKPEYYCSYDLKLKRVVEEKVTGQNGAVPLYYYGPLKFSADKENFYYDNLFDLQCYGSAKTYELLLPYLSPTHGEVAPSKFYQDFLEKLPKEECPAAGTLKQIETELGGPTRDESEYYDDNGLPINPERGNIVSIEEKCDSQEIYLYIFIASAVIAAIVTCLFIALIIVICIAKKKMIKQGHRLPKKPWETQATEDNATLLDQTVGVTEATTVGGETSAYTTVGQ